MILFDIDTRDTELRHARQAASSNGVLPDFPAVSAAKRQADWRVERQAAAAASTTLLLPDVQSASEAAAWAGRLQDRNIDGDTGVVIWVDSLWGAFEFENILYELKDIVTAVRRDADGFLFGFIEAFQRFPQFVLPDRDDINEATHFLRSFRQLVASACSRRGVTFGDPDWSEVQGSDVPVEAADLLLVPRGRITKRGMRLNIRTALGYLRRGHDAVGDDETALREASAGRLAAAQLWQWVRHETGVLDIGRIVTPALFESLLEEELAAAGDRNGLSAAAESLSATVLGESFTMHGFCDTASHLGPQKQ